jgi:hypothetical protein
MALSSRGGAMSANTRWSLRNIYLYLVCLITLIMVIVAVVGAVRNVAELAYPDPGYYEEPIPLEEDGSAVDPDAAERNRQTRQESERRYAILGLVGNVAMLLVAGPIYVYHWRKIETEPAASEERARDA